MKRSIAIALTVCLLCGLPFTLTACGEDAAPAPAPEATPVEPDWTAVATPADEPNAADQPQANPADNNQVE